MAEMSSANKEMREKIQKQYKNIKEKDDEITKLKKEVYYLEIGSNASDLIMKDIKYQDSQRVEDNMALPTTKNQSSSSDSRKLSVQRCLDVQRYPVSPKKSFNSLKNRESTSYGISSKSEQYRKGPPASSCATHSSSGDSDFELEVIYPKSHKRKLSDSTKPLSNLNNRSVQTPDGTDKSYLLAPRSFLLGKSKHRHSTVNALYSKDD